MSDDGFLWQGSPVGEPVADSPPGPRGARRRILALGAFASLGALGAVLALALAGGSGLNTVAQAASVTDAQPGYQFTMDIAATVGATTQHLDASGTVSQQPQPVMSMQMTVGGTSVNAVLATPWEYLKLGSTWFKINLNTYDQALGGAGLSPTSTDPSQILHYLEATGTVTTVGTEAVGGVATTHYRAQSNLTSAAATFPPSQRAAATKALTTLAGELGVTSIPIDVWVDGQGRVRQTAIALNGLCSKQGPIDETVTMTFEDYGPQAAPAVPSSALDLTSAAQSQAATVRQQTLCSG